MNRHSPLFRVAFFSLLLAISLPLLVLLAAQVRHRQLQSKSNPRWAQFKEINESKGLDDAGSKTASTVEPQVATTDPPPKPSRIPVRTASQPNGMTGSAAGRTQSQSAPPATDSVAIEMPVERPRPTSVEPKSRRPATLPSTEVAASPLTQTSPPAAVPDPDDLDATDALSPPKIVRSPARPMVEFRTLDNTNRIPQTNQIEARLMGLQRQLDQLAQAQSDKHVSDLTRVLNMLEQTQQAQQAYQSQQNQLLKDLRPDLQPVDVSGSNRTIQRRNGTGNAISDATPPPPAPGPATIGSPGITTNGPRREPSIKIVQGDAGEDDERFSIQVQDANLTEVLEMLGQLSGVNILASRDIQGRVSLNLQDVTVDRALDAILKSQGCMYEREGDFVFIRTTAEDAALKLANRKLVTKVYQLHYISAGELQKLIDPMLTKGVGSVSVTSPAQSGIASSPTTAGGDGLAQRDTLLVQDYPEVVAEIDRVIIELDVPPLQVLIEAKILSVALSDSMAFGVNFAMLNGAHNSQVLSGNGSTLNGAVGFPATAALVPPAGDFIANTAGLKYGFIQGDISGFIKALESIADTTLVAAPQLRVLNKQKAEMIIGERLSYKTLAFNGTQTVENVQFLDAGTKLIFRPFISPDGLVRLEVHPEKSKATINEQTGLPNSETTQVTTNVMVRDGTTVVLGGLISEEVTESIDRVPVLGAIPLVGAAFRNRTERTQRNELIVLITPRIVTEPEAAIEGDRLQFETQARAAHFRDNLSPVNRTSLMRAHYDRACLYYEQGNLLKARQQIDAALLQSKGDLECQKLKLKIDQSIKDQQSRAWHWPMSSRSAQRQ